MKSAKNLEDYDNDLFFIFKNEFSSKYKNRFSNETLFNSWEKKCNYIILFFKNIISKESLENFIIKDINILLEFITEKNEEENNDLKYLSSFKDEIFIDYRDKILSFRNLISTFFFKLIIKYKDEKYEDDEEDPIFNIIQEALDAYLSKEYLFLKGLFDLLKYSLDNNVNIYEEFLLILNNKNIIQKIINNKNCILNSNQKEFLLSQKIHLGESLSFLDKLKNITITNDQLLEEIKIAKTETKKRNKKKKTKKILSNFNPNEKEEIKLSSQIENKKLEIIEKNNINSFHINNHDNKNIFIINNKENINLKEKEKEREKDSYLLEKFDFLEKENKLLHQEIDELKNMIIKEKNENLKMRKEIINLENKIKIFELKINIMGYSGLIKDLINYSYDFFNCPKENNIKLDKKVKLIQKIMSSENETNVLNNREKLIFSNFISFSFLILKNSNNENIYEDKNELEDSINNLVKCLTEYLELHNFEITKENNKNNCYNIEKYIPKKEDIQSILDKIKFNYDNYYNYNDDSD